MTDRPNWLRVSRSAYSDRPLPKPVQEALLLDHVEDACGTEALPGLGFGDSLFEDDQDAK
jgi:hypothetical protein